jgi:anti-sigma B factor antagonist
MPAFTIKQETLETGVVMVAVHGYLDAHTFEQLEEVIAENLAGKRNRIVVDLSGVNYISSAGAGVFIWALSEAQGAGGNMVLLKPTQPVMEVFKLLGLDQVFRISHDRAAALGMFSG